MKKVLIYRGGCLVKNMGSNSDKSRTPEIRETDCSTTLLARDYKGLSNYNSNCVIEIYKVVNDG